MHACVTQIRDDSLVHVLQSGTSQCDCPRTERRARGGVKGCDVRGPNDAAPTAGTRERRELSPPPSPQREAPTRASSSSLSTSSS
eukprot:CAMPEP_0185310582 /NCGR_PEP_ID=MMETSP1363-20130426/25487_1 /TAXON_ID=38817 /ORGANISM="Gephyrocapsa oceanica, Strain RCC1303" /LENGTH=84 /DNA_ID=CAMNT_0027908157 /DNA_START=56 /DNA_END=307 /DNA_ORIENTATION=+